MSFKIAIVGRPNVGKSSLFNRIIGKRHAITHQKKGITRDRIYATAHWLTKTFGVIDTGGIEIKSTPFLEQIKIQAQLAVDEADVIVFVVDGQIGLTQNDSYLAKLLYKTKNQLFWQSIKLTTTIYYSILMNFMLLDSILLLQLVLNMALV